MVVVTNSYEMVNNINPFVLHYGTEEECKEFIKQLGHSLNVLKVKGICSTQTDRVDIETNYTEGRLQTDCDCDYCRCNCS